jgi:hypothetical protein
VVETGLSLGFGPGELSLSVPYWTQGEEAQETMALVRRIAAAVEQATGLTAYDPQTDGPLLAGDVDESVAVFDRTADFARDIDRDARGRASGSP